jgi:hypothetical protein
VFLVALTGVISSPRPKKIGFFLISFADPEACTAKSPVSGPRPKIHKNPGPVEECNPECSLDELRDAAYRNPEINVRDFYMRTTQGRVNFIVSEADVHEVTFPEDYKVDSMEVRPFCVFVFLFYRKKKSPGAQKVLGRDQESA